MNCTVFRYNSGNRVSPEMLNTLFLTVCPELSVACQLFAKRGICECLPKLNVIDCLHGNLAGDCMEFFGIREQQARITDAV